MFSKYIIDNFKKKLATYDKENWEVIIEKKQEKILNSLNSFESEEDFKISTLREDLIDVDLIRGSLFYKTKPTYDWFQVTRKAVLRIILYPLYYYWWCQHLNQWLNILFLFIYGILNSMLLSHKRIEHIVSFDEIYCASISFFILGEIFIHAVSTNFSKPVSIKNSQNMSCNTNIEQSNQDTTSLSNKRSSPTKRPKFTSTTIESSNSIENVVHVDSISRPIVINTFNNYDEPIHKTKGVRFSKSFEENAGLSPNCNNLLGSHSIGSVNSSADECIGPTDNDSRGSSSSMSENEIEQSNDSNLFNSSKPTDTSMSQPYAQIDEKVMVSVWHGNICKKTRLTILEISTTIVNHVEIFSSNYDYSTITVIFCIIMGFLPMTYRVCLALINHNYKQIDIIMYSNTSLNFILKLFYIFYSIIKQECSFLLVVIIFIRLVCILCFMFMLIGAEHTYWQRLLYAKYFGALTSTRRAKRNGLPHFRLHKAKNIKAWLSIRSFIKKFGPQRSMDTIVSATFLLSVGLISIVCLQMIDFGSSEKHEGTFFFFSSFANWDLFFCCALNCYFLLRFMSLGTEINNKYRNYSVLLTEQMNLYLQMEQSPQKKESYTIANNMLKLSCKLLKELERPFKVSGFIMNPFLRNITRVIALSLFSGVISSLFGIRIKFWKIKIN